MMPEQEPFVLNLDGDEGNADWLQDLAKEMPGPDAPPMKRAQAQGMALSTGAEPVDEVEGDAAP